ncbi:MAG: arylsulfatase [Rubripirellula sp.]
MLGEISSVIPRVDRRLVWFLQGFAIALIGMHADSPLHAQGTYDRTRIPVADVRPETNQEIDPSKATMPKHKPFGAPANAPNVVIILLDDLGFGGPAAFGGPIRMPTLDRLAKNGLRYTRFHTCALCAPTRVALKQGRNHHVVNMGSIPEIATGFPGNTSRVPNDTAPLAEILRLNGYNTAAFGKWHATLGRETTASGSQDRWPTRQGFEKFYGFIGAEENNFEPSLHDGVTNIDVQESDDYHVIDDMTRESIEWMHQQHSMTPEKPFFIYYASPGVHAPHHVTGDWIERYRGEFDQGWDVARQATLERQIQMGIVPEGTTLAKPADSIVAWESLSDDQKTVYARQAEAFAAFAEYTDFQAGRLIQAIDDIGELDNTLVIYITGDNGTSSEGNQTGNWNWGHMLNGVPETTEEQMKYLDKWGGPETYPHMSVGWAVAFDSPFAHTKQVAGDFGGTRNGTVIHWPAAIRSNNEIRTQFSHVIDVAPTILEAAQIPEPEYVNGIKQFPMQGQSLLYSFNDADAEEKHSKQYFEIVGNRGMYSDGWMARVTVKYPWETNRRRQITDDQGWELFNTLQDFSMANNLADKYPERLEQLKQQFATEAISNGVFPLDDRLLERLLPEVAGRPTLMGDRKSITLYPGAINVNENALINVKNRSSKVTAEIEIVDPSNTEGVIMAQGGRFGGWVLFVEDGYAGYAYNNLGDLTIIKSPKPLKPGPQAVIVEIQYEGEGAGDGAVISLKSADQPTAIAKLDSSVASRFSIDEGADVGRDRGSPVLTRQITDVRQSPFSGEIKHVTIEVE